MTYVPVRSGFTGPSEKIGGSSEYHVDLKMLQSLPLEEKVKAFDAIAQKYKSLGRDIEFSNTGVAGSKYDLSLPYQKRAELLSRAAQAHSHSTHSGWDSLDFYVPFAGKSRFDPGAVEDASIFVPTVPGGKVTRGSGGGYGYFSEVFDPSGKKVFRVGHGNIDRPEEGEFSVPAQTQPSPEATASQPSPGKTSNQPSKAKTENELLSELVLGALASPLNVNVNIPEIKPPPIARGEEEESELGSLEQALRDKLNSLQTSRSPAVPKLDLSELGATKQNMSRLIAEAQRAFSPGKSVF